MLGDTAGILSSWASQVALLPGATGNPEKIQTTCKYDSHSILYILELW